MDKKNDEISNIYELIRDINNIQIIDIYMKGKRRYVKYLYKNELFDTTSLSFKSKIKNIKLGKDRRYSINEINEIVKSYDSNLEIIDIYSKITTSSKIRYCVLKFYNDIIEMPLSQIVKLKFTIDKKNKIFKKTNWNENRIKLFLKYNYDFLQYIKYIRKNKNIWIYVYNKKNNSYEFFCFDSLLKHKYKFTNLPVGEQLIKNKLDELKIKYEQQKTFEGLKYKISLRCDFYLLDFNTVIEFNGMQHYSENSFLHKNLDSFKETQIKDLIKKQYCLEHNINFIEIPYYNINLIDKIIEDIVQKK